MSLLGVFAAIAVVQFLAAASPGPSFIVISSHASSGSRKTALFSAMGVLIATVTWAGLAVLGLGAVLAAYPRLYMVIQYAGAAYLIWLGLRMVIAGIKNRYREPLMLEMPTLSHRKVVAEGFLINITNPKTIAYYTSLFTALIPADAASWVFIAGAAVAVGVSAVWWVSVALLFSTGAIKAGYSKARRYIDMVMGGALVLLGLRLVANR